MGISRKGVTIFVAGVVSLVLGANHSFAVDWPSVIENAKAKYAKFEEEVKDMTTTQEMKIVTPEGEITSLTNMLRKGEKFRMESSMQMSDSAQLPEEMRNMEIVSIYDGKDIWMISFMGKKKLSAEEGKQYQKEKNWWDLVSEKAEIIGTESIGDRKCYVVEIKEEGESPFTKIWLDNERLVLVKGESKGAEGEAILFVCSDFRKIKGDWEMPYKTEIYAGDKLMSTSLVKSVELDKGLSDDLFDPDKAEIKGLDMQEIMKKMMQEEEGE